MKKHILKLLFLGFSLAIGACSDDNDPVVPDALPVNYANIAGTWQLTEWNGEPMNDKRYCYMIIGRKADEQTGKRSLETYLNIDSDKSRHLTSTYELESDEELGVIIRGVYDYAGGFWNNSYIIKNMASDSMTWIVENDPSDVSVYTRCDVIPEDILNETRAL